MKKFFLSLAVISVFQINAFASPLIKSIFFDDSIIIYGTQNKETSRQENNNAFSLKKKIKTLIDITQDEYAKESTLKNKNLIILSNNKSNKILNFINLPNVKSNFPLEIKESSFVFNKIRQNRLC